MPRAQGFHKEYCMDQVKIGKYLSEKRKSLGLTQAQLADRLNMSDKSVSKWERGICLPDVSLYQELCAILGITVNEFLAGEDISSENLEKKSEDTIIQVATDSKHRQKKLTRYVCLFIFIAAILLTALLVVLCFNNNSGPQNYFEQIHDTSVEMYEMLSGQNPYVFHFSIQDTYNSLELWCREYCSGELSSESMLSGMGGDTGIGPHEVTVVIVFNPDTYSMRFMVKTENGSSSTQFEVLPEIEDKQSFGRGWETVMEQIPVIFEEEQDLFSLSFNGHNGQSEKSFVYNFSFIARK